MSDVIIILSAVAALVQQDILFDASLQGSDGLIVTPVNAVLVSGQWLLLVTAQTGLVACPADQS